MMPITLYDTLGQLREDTMELGSCGGVHFWPSDAQGAAADFDDNDVIFVFPVSAVWYPMSDIGLMT